MPFVPASLGGPVAHAAVISGAAQLTFTLDQPAAFLNGEPTRLQSVPRVLDGRAMLPLRETAALLGQPLLGGAGQVQIGRGGVRQRNAGRPVSAWPTTSVCISTVPS